MREILKCLDETNHVGLVFPDKCVSRIGHGRAAMLVFTWGDPLRIVGCCTVDSPNSAARGVARSTVRAAIDMEKEIRWKSMK